MNANPQSDEQPRAHQSLFAGSVLRLVMLGHIVVRDQRVNQEDHRYAAEESQVGRPDADGLDPPLQQLDERDQDHGPGREAQRQRHEARAGLANKKPQQAANRRGQTGQGRKQKCETDRGIHFVLL